MFSFIPEFLIIFSTAGIAVIILRKVPGVEDFVKRTPLRDVPVRGAVAAAKRIWGWILLWLKKLWKFVIEVKVASRTAAISSTFAKLPRTFSKIHFPKTALLKKVFKTDSAEFYVSQGLDSLAKANFADAERKFIKAIEKDPKSEAAYQGLGRLYLSQKKFEEAVETYKFLLKHYPPSDVYYGNLGLAYHNQKLYDQAVEAYEQAIELDPNDAKRYINLGLTLEAKKHLEEAILNYRKALDLEKDNTHFMLVLTDALIKKGEKEEAELMLEQILQMDPTNHAAREKLMQLKF